MVMNNTSHSLWAYDISLNDFRRFDSEMDWEAHITKEGVVKYLTRHLKKAINDDFDPAYSAYLREKRGGYFALLRMLFPSITFLGTLYKGSDASSSAVAFIREYLGKVNRKYEGLGDLIYLVFRHGLIHTHMPKVILVGDTEVGWVITYEDKDHLNVNKLGLKPLNIYISPHQLRIDLLKAIDYYIEDFYDIQKSDLLFQNFMNGFITMVKFYNKSEFRMNCNKGLDYIRKMLTQTS